MPFHDVGGCRLHYLVDGPAERPALLLSNSLGTDTGLWEPQLEALAARFRLIRYDTRGHGKSDVTPGPYTLEGLGRDALALLDGLGIGRAHVAGISMGGMTALWLAANAPDRVGRIVPACTSAHIGNPDLWNQRIQTVEAKGMAGVAEGVLARWFTEGFMRRQAATVAKVRTMLMATPAAGYAASCAAVRDMDLRPVLGRIKAPALVIAGREDLATPLEHGRAIAAGVAGAKLLELDCAHLGNVEAAERFTPAVVEFLTAGAV